MVDSVVDAGAVGGGSSPQGERIVGFWGRRKSLFGLLIVNMLLGAVTFGIYRFWARTRLRQYFWNSIEIDGDILEYTGRGLELFIGFLIVIAVLVPLAIGYQFLSLFLQVNAPDLFTVVTFLYFLGFYWLSRYAYFRARRYRLARTVWRGIRGGQDGSAAGYAWLSFGYGILSLITLGWAVPWMTVELQKYEVEHARFGVENFSYEGNGTELLRRWMPCGVVVTLAILSAIVTSVVNWAEIQAFMAAAAQVGDGSDEFLTPPSSQLISMYGVTMALYVLAIPLYIYYRLGAFRYMLNAASLADVGFVAEFSGWRLVGYGLLNFLIVIGLSALVFALFSAFGVLALFAEGEAGTVDPALAVVGIILSFIPIILLIFFLPMIGILFFYYPSIRHIATTLRLTDITSLARIVQSSKDDPRFGEGLAAALDVDVGGF